MKAEVIIPAAGLGLRMALGVPKPLVVIAAKPLLVHTLSVFEKNDSVKRIIIAIRRENLQVFQRTLKKYHLAKKFDLIIGGHTRKDSVRNCLKELSSDAEFVIIHDAVRPFIDNRLINTLLKEAYRSGAAVCGVPEKATIKTVNSKCEIKSTLDRDEVWEIQTPQVFRKEIILKAYEKYGKSSVTDDASLVEKLGVGVKVVRGSYFNIKITTPEDLVFAKAIFKKWL